MNKENNLKVLKELEAKGVSFDVLTRASFLLNVTNEIQPKISSDNFVSVSLEYEKFIVVIWNNFIKLYYNGIEEKYEDETIIEKVKELLL